MKQPKGQTKPHSNSILYYSFVALVWIFLFCLLLFAAACIIAALHSTTHTIECVLKVLWSYTFISIEGGEKNRHLATWSLSGIFFFLPQSKSCEKCVFQLWHLKINFFMVYSFLIKDNSWIRFIFKYIYCGIEFTLWLPLHMILYYMHNSNS